MPGLQLCTDLRPWLLMASWKHRSLSTITSMIHPVSQDKHQTFIYNIYIYRKCHASCVVSKQFNKFATCMAEPSFACRSAQVPVKLKMRCCTAAHCMPCNMPGSLQLKHVFADCLWMRSRATGGGTESICIHSHPMLSAVHIDRAARSEHMAAF